ncbi:Histone deacetylase 6-like protein [Drosera capensis]
MSKEVAAASSSSSRNDEIETYDEESMMTAMAYGSEWGWVEPRTDCNHLGTLSSSSDLFHIPTPDTPCSRCDHPAENWLCLCCKDVLCSRFINKHMLEHYQSKGDCLALSYSDLSVWCFNCDAYLDAQLIRQLRPVYETAYLLKFGEEPPLRPMDTECMLLEPNLAGSSL